MAISANDFIPYDWPVIGPWTYKVGKIVRLYTTPCSPDTEAWVFGFWHAIPQMLAAVYALDCIDLVYERRGGVHRRGRRKRMRIIDQILGEEPRPKGWGWAVFKLGDWAQRLGFYMTIVDATLDGAIIWQSAAMTYQGCAVPGSGWCHQRLGERYYGSGVEDHPVQSWALTTNHIFSFSPTSILIPAGASALVRFNYPGTPPRISVKQDPAPFFRLVDVANNFVGAEGTATVKSYGGTPTLGLLVAPKLPKFFPVEQRWQVLLTTSGTGVVNTDKMTFRADGWVEGAFAPDLNQCLPGKGVQWPGTWREWWDSVL
jgi:hypothetical protein